MLDGESFHWRWIRIQKLSSVQYEMTRLANPWDSRHARFLALPITRRLRTVRHAALGLISGICSILNLANNAVRELGRLYSIHASVRQGDSHLDPLRFQSSSLSPALLWRECKLQQWQGALHDKPLVRINPITCLGNAPQKAPQSLASQHGLIG
jgi:hypothetical protein